MEERSYMICQWFVRVLTQAKMECFSKLYLLWDIKIEISLTEITIGRRWGRCEEDGWGDKNAQAAVY